MGWTGWGKVGVEVWGPARPRTHARPPSPLPSPSHSLTLPARTTMYLLAAIRAASSASEQICSFSQDTMWMQYGNASTGARLLPAS